MFKNSRFSKRDQRGIGLLEISIGLVIVVVAAALIVGAFQDSRMKAKTKESMDAVSAIHFYVKDRYSGSANYYGVTQATIADAGFLPSSMIVGPGVIHHAFGREIHMDSQWSSTVFRIRLIYVPQEACMLMVTQDMGRDLVSVDVGGVTVSGRAMTPAEARTGCYASANVHPRWTFK
jgi:type II secretory pathway pseudopilin PulG